MGFRHMWQVFKGRAPLSQAEWPHKKATVRTFSMQMEQFIKSSFSCSWRCSSRTCWSVFGKAIDSRTSAPSERSTKGDLNLSNVYMGVNPGVEGGDGQSFHPPWKWRRFWHNLSELPYLSTLKSWITTKFIFWRLALTMITQIKICCNPWE